MAIKFLQLADFRNHKHLSLNVDAKFVRIVGANGNGKTNILESISYMSPGYGIRGEKYEHAINHLSSERLWSVDCRLESDKDESILRTGFMLGSKKFQRANETVLRSSADLLEHLRVVWISPKIDGVFGESNTARRNFFDRMCYNAFPSHASTMNILNKALQSRNKIIKTEMDDCWLSAYEQTIVTKSLEVAQIRRLFLQMLQDELLEFKSAFLKPDLAIECRVQDVMLEAGEEAPQILLAEIKEARGKDRYTGRSSVGAHKSLLEISHPLKKINVSFCSTGEQKAMMISTLIAHLRCIRARFDGPIILLLDDIFSHLDDANKRRLIDELSARDAQVWITSTEDYDYLFDAENSMKINL